MSIKWDRLFINLKAFRKCIFFVTKSDKNQLKLLLSQPHAETDNCGRLSQRLTSQIIHTCAQTFLDFSFFAFGVIHYCKKSKPKSVLL